jgi:hypothetical protein
MNWQTPDAPHRSGGSLQHIGKAGKVAGDLGDGIGLVGWLELAGEQGVFARGLHRQPGVDAAAAEQQPLSRRAYARHE